jgi:hypothetical protein
MKTSANGSTKTAPISVEYPQEGEVITSPSYAFRIDAAAARVEIAVDGDVWASCRRSDGYWWFDWSDYESGHHQALVREAPRGGPEAPARVRRFFVELPGTRPR